MQSKGGFSLFARSTDSKQNVSDLALDVSQSIKFDKIYDQLTIDRSKTTFVRFQVHFQNFFITFPHCNAYVFWTVVI